MLTDRGATAFPTADDLPLPVGQLLEKLDVFIINVLRWPRTGRLLYESPLYVKCVGGACLRAARWSHSSIRASSRGASRVAQVGGFELAKTAPSKSEHGSPESDRARLHQDGRAGVHFRFCAPPSLTKLQNSERNTSLAATPCCLRRAAAASSAKKA